MNGQVCRALVDTGCSKTIVFVGHCKEWRHQEVIMVTVSGDAWTCAGTATVQLGVAGAPRVCVEANVTKTKPLEYDCILGMDAIGAWKGVTIGESREVIFGAQGQSVCAVKNAEPSGIVECKHTDRKKGQSVRAVKSAEPPAVMKAVKVDERDFSVTFAPVEKTWTVAWKWRDSQEPGVLKNTLGGYAIPPKAVEEYEKEIQEWIRQGWLLPYDEEKLGVARGLIPMMAVIQQTKEKVRPVLDFRELNQYIDAYTGAADVCADKMRDWRKMGVNVSMVDLAKAYLQIRVQEELWSYQTVIFQGQRYCLTRLGFGLNVAPLVMKAVLDYVLAQDERVSAGTSAYVDDILVNEDVVSAERVKEHLCQYGLVSKPAERVRDGARALGLHVWGDHETLRWSRNGEVQDVPEEVTRRDVFSLCGKLVGHYPVCGWLRVAAAFVKRRASQATERWDDVVSDATVVKHLREMTEEVKRNDPVKGRWDVASEAVKVWVDASSIAMGAVIEMNGNVVEDACWLRKEVAGHINMAELDALIKGLNLALAWRVTEVEVVTDSATVHRWITDGLTGKSRLRTKAANEMLIRRRVAIVTELVREYELSVTVSLVPSSGNKADALTRVPERWLRQVSTGPTVCAMVMGDTDRVVREIHHEVGHPGVRRTWYFVKRREPGVSCRQVRKVVKECDVCKSIDPAPVQWTRGSLGVARVWQRVGMDITHCKGQHYLTLIDCGPSRFTIWRRISLQTSECVIAQLEAVFHERGAPEEILTDNDTAFKSRRFQEFAEKWNVHMRYRCAHAPSGNGVVERCHRTVKVIAARKGCGIGEAVYWYNATPRDDRDVNSAPANVLYRYTVRVRGVDGYADKTPRKEDEEPYRVGDVVWVKQPEGRCDTPYEQGRVTRVVSPHAMEVNGVPRHIRDLRLCTEEEDEVIECRVPDSDDDDECWPGLPQVEGGPVSDEGSEGGLANEGGEMEDEPHADSGAVLPRRSARLAERARQRAEERGGDGESDVRR